MLVPPMRDHGLVTSAAGLGLHGHACWTYADDAELVRAAAEYLADGARLGQRLVYVAPHPDVEAIARREPILREHAVEGLPLSAFYEPGQPSDPDRLLAIYTAATDDALAAGFTGLRVVAEVTELAADPSCQCRWESVADRMMAERPLSALCCYDRRRLPRDVVRDLCAVHPVVNDPVPFRIYAAGGGLRLDGEVDFFASDALRRVLPLTTHGDDTLDLSGAAFIDHHGARVLLESGVALAGIPHSMRRACDLMGLS
jgi:MEDS: MEthanogen/methylotroph, DcmR Sensory domain